MPTPHTLLPLILLLVLLLTPSQSTAAKFVVSQIERTISLKAPAFTFTSLKISTKSQDGGQFGFTLAPESMGGPLSQLECAVGSTLLQHEAKASPSGISISLPLPAGEVSLACEYRRLSGKRALPPQIAQSEHQKFLFEGERVRIRLCPSCTLDGNEKTIVLLPSSRVESFVESLKPASVTGRAATFGPYTSAATAEERDVVLTVHYEHDTPVPVATSVEREIEISHYGNVAVEEFFDLRHAGAQLKGSFSRLDHQFSPSPNAFQELTAVLPVQARDVYYRDSIGNVTSSHLRVVPGQRQDLELQFRFPLFGGWHIEWYQGYNLPLSAWVSALGADRFQLECDFMPPFKGLVTEQLVVKVVLPAGAKNWKVHFPTELYAQSLDERFSYLDVPWAPRTVLILEARNVVAEGKPMRLRVSYSLPSWHLLEKPLAVFCISLFCFIVAMVSNRMQWSFDRVKGE